MKQAKRWIGRALCMGLTASCVISFNACDRIFSLLSNSFESGLESVNGQSGTDNASGVVIDSLDKFNYYAAKKTIEDAYRPAYARAENAKTGAIKPTAYEDEDVYYDSSAEYGYGYETSDGQVIEGERPDSVSPPKGDATVVYYDLYEWDHFTVNRTIYFQMELSDENAFLGSRLGTGTVEVAVALGDYYDDLNMITFRNGDKFYSCMYHGYGGVDETTGAEKYYFAAYRYIEGFYYVKNLQWEHYEFCVSVGLDGAEFTCNYQHTGEENEQVNVKAGSTYCVDKTVTYTIEELEAYFNGETEQSKNSGESSSETLPSDSVAESLPADSVGGASSESENLTSENGKEEVTVIASYSSTDSRVFVLRSDKSFILYKSEKGNPTLGEGTYRFIDGGIEFCFISGCDAAHVTVQEGEDYAFVYDGGVFYPDMID